VYLYTVEVDPTKKDPYCYSEKDYRTTSLVPHTTATATPF